MYEKIFRVVFCDFVIQIFDLKYDQQKVMKERKKDELGNLGLTIELQNVWSMGRQFMLHNSILNSHNKRQPVTQENKSSHFACEYFHNCCCVHF